MLLAFYKKDNPDAEFKDKIISWWTKGPYSHVEIVTLEDDGRLCMYSSSGRSGGVRKKKHIFNTDIWDYVKINIDERILEYFYNITKSSKYDYAAIFGFIVPFLDREDKWICSEWCSTVLKMSGDLRFAKKDPARISPNELYRIVTGE